MQVVPSVGSTARVAHRVAAVEEQSGSLCFTKLAEELAQAKGARAFMDKVRGLLLFCRPPCFLELAEKAVVRKTHVKQD